MMSFAASLYLALAAEINTTSSGEDSMETTDNYMKTTQVGLNEIVEAIALTKWRHAVISKLGL